LSEKNTLDLAKMILTFQLQLILFFLSAVKVALCLMPLNFMENSENCSFDLLLQSTDEGEMFRETLFSSPNYVDHIQKRLPVFHELGYLD
jgi:hypothetical protein